MVKPSLAKLRYISTSYLFVPNNKARLFSSSRAELGSLCEPGQSDDALGGW